MKIKMIAGLLALCCLLSLVWAAEEGGMVEEKFDRQNEQVEAPPNEDGQQGIPQVLPIAKPGKKNLQQQGKAEKKVFFWGITEDILLAFLAMPIAALLAATLAYHPSRIRKTGVKQEERDVPKALLLIGVGGAVVCSLDQYRFQYGVCAIRLRQFYKVPHTG